MKIRVNNLQPGMMLAEDAVGPNGRMLLKDGTVVEDKHIRILDMWGVAEVDVCDDTATGASCASGHGHPPEVMEQALTHVDKLFSVCGTDHEILVELRHLCLERAAERIEAGHPFVATAPDLGVSELDLDEAEIPSSQELVEMGDRLASLPDIYFKIAKTVEDPSASAVTLGNMVAKDPNLAARLLKLVNSPLYALSAPIDSIDRAVALVGTNEVCRLALAITVVDTFEGVPGEIINMREFWKHSVCVGIAADVISTHLSGGYRDKFFIPGLLHDVGRLIMLMTLSPELLNEIFTEHYTGSSLFSAEISVLDFDHAEVGGMLLEKWNFSPHIVDCVRYHHAPTLAEKRQETAVMHLADIIAIAMGFGSGGSSIIPEFDPEAGAVLELEPADLEIIVGQTERQVDEVARAILGG